MTPIKHADLSDSDQVATTLSDREDLSTDLSENIINTDEEDEKEEDNSEDHKDNEDHENNKNDENDKNNEEDENKSETKMNENNINIKVCDYTLESIVRNFNTTSYLPNDYSEVYHKMVNGQMFNQIHHINDSIAIVERLLQYWSNLTNHDDVLDAKMFLGLRFIKVANDLHIGVGCLTDVFRMFDGIRKNELWALKFFDSFGSFPPNGLLTGRFSSFGSFDQCLSIKSSMQYEDDDEEDLVYGRYCQVRGPALTPSPAEYSPQFETILRGHRNFPNIVEFSKQLNLDRYLENRNIIKIVSEFEHELNGGEHFNYGVCFPEKCSPEDIEKLVNLVWYPFTKIPLTVKSQLCDTHHDLKQFKWNNIQKASIIFFAVLFVLVLITSLCHLWINNLSLFANLNVNHRVSSSYQSLDYAFDGENSKFIQSKTFFINFVYSFSAIENTTKLFTTPSNRYHALDSIRFICIIFLFALQSFWFVPFGDLSIALRNYFNTVPYELTHSSAYWFARTPGIWIDGLVFVMGTVLCIAQFQALDKSKHFHLMIYVFKRWLRLSIGLLSAILILNIYPLIGSGPMWHLNEKWLVEPTKHQSWLLSSFLYYNNFNLANSSLQTNLTILTNPSWYLSMSFQLYLLAPLLILPLYFNPHKGVIATLIVISLTSLLPPSYVLICGFPTYLDATKMISLLDSIQSIVNNFANPVQYITSFCFGLLTGFLIHRHSKMQIIGGQVGEAILWFASFASLIAIFFWNETLWSGGHSQLNILAWFVCSKLMLSGALAFISYMCCTGRGGIVNQILSLQITQPISRLAFGIFLLKVPVIWYRITSVRHTYEMHHFQTWQLIYIDFTMTTILAYIMYLLVEAPTLALINLLTKNETQIKTNDQIKPKIDKSNGVQDESSVCLRKWGSTDRIDQSDLI